MLRVSELPPVVRQWLRCLYASLPCETHHKTVQLPAVFNPVEVRRLQEWKSFDSRRRKFERVWAREMYKLLTAVRNKVVETYRFTPRSLNIILQITQQELGRRLPVWYSDAYISTEREFINKPRENVVKKELKADTDIIDVFDLPELVEWNRTVTAERIVQVSRYTMEVVKRVVTGAIDQGTGIDLVAMRLENIFAFSRTRSERIARTEIVGASNAANFFGAVRLIPDLETKNWISTGDRRTRPTHRTAGATQRDIPYANPFEVGGSLLMFPGDPSLGAAAKEIINCRCGVTFGTTAASIDDIIEDARREGRRRR